MYVTPYEEINELVGTLRQVKEVTLEGTDLEYFSKAQLLSLIEVSQQMTDVAKTMVAQMEEE